MSKTETLTPNVIKNYVINGDTSKQIQYASGLMEKITNFSTEDKKLNRDIPSLGNGSGGLIITARYKRNWKFSWLEKDISISQVSLKNCWHYMQDIRNQDLDTLKISCLCHRARISSSTFLEH
jgi:hypothetical protein